MREFLDAERTVVIYLELHWSCSIVLFSTITVIIVSWINLQKSHGVYKSQELLLVPNLGWGSTTPPWTPRMSATPSLWRRKSDMLSLWRRFVPTPPIFIREIILWKRFRCRNDSMSTPALSNQWRSPSKVYPKMHRSSYLHITPDISLWSCMYHTHLTISSGGPRESSIVPTRTNFIKKPSQFSIVVM